MAEQDYDDAEDILLSNLGDADERDADERDKGADKPRLVRRLLVEYHDERSVLNKVLEYVKLGMLVSLISMAVPLYLKVQDVQDQYDRVSVQLDMLKQRENLLESTATNTVAMQIILERQARNVTAMIDEYHALISTTNKTMHGLIGTSLRDFSASMSAVKAIADRNTHDLSVIHSFVPQFRLLEAQDGCQGTNAQCQRACTDKGWVPVAILLSLDRNVPGNDKTSWFIKFDTPFPTTDTNRYTYQIVCYQYKP